MSRQTFEAWAGAVKAILTVAGTSFVLYWLRTLSSPRWPSPGFPESGKLCPGRQRLLGRRDHREGRLDHLMSYDEKRRAGGTFVLAAESFRISGVDP